MTIQNADTGTPRSPPDPPVVQGEGDAAPSRPGRAWYRDPFIALALAAALGLDQLTKWLITSNLDRYESIPAEGFFRLTHVQNSGSAFGLFQDQGMILTIVAVIAVAAIIVIYRTSPMPSLLMRVALGLQIGGAIGNLIDRLRYEGSVIDFVDVGPWPVFNVADSCLVVGIIILAWHFGTGRDRPGRAAPPDGPSEDNGTSQAPSLPPTS